MSQVEPIRVAVVDDYDVIVMGTASLLAPHADLVRVVECNAEGLPDEEIDIALLDCFALDPDGAALIGKVAAHENVDRVVAYTWGNAVELIDAALAYGASGVVSKGLSGRDLAAALVRAHEGERVVEVATRAAGAGQHDGRDVAGRRWPGQDLGLTERESEVLAHITQGRRTADIAESLYLSVNSIKTHTRHLFRKIGVSTRTEAALWGVDHGFRPDRSSRDAWSRRPPPGS